jgi:excisionase family DNA binding protein
MVTTYTTAEVADKLGCAERWLQDQLRAGRFRGRKIGRNWRMTDSDVQFALDVCANKVVTVVADVAPAFSSLSKTSRRRLG